MRPNRKRPRRPRSWTSTRAHCRLNCWCATVPSSGVRMSKSAFPNRRFATTIAIAGTVPMRPIAIWHTTRCPRLASTTRTMRWVATICPRVSARESSFCCAHQSCSSAIRSFSAKLLWYYSMGPCKLSPGFKNEVPNVIIFNLTILDPKMLQLFTILIVNCNLTFWDRKR